MILFGENNESFESYVNTIHEGMLDDKPSGYKKEKNDRFAPDGVKLTYTAADYINHVYLFKKNEKTYMIYAIHKEDDTRSQDIKKMFDSIKIDE